MKHDGATRTMTRSSIATGRGDAASVPFGRLLAARRSALGLSQAELAVRTQTRRSAIARIENGQGPANGVLFRRLEDALTRESAPAAIWDHESPMARGTSRERPRPARVDPVRRGGLRLAAATAAASIVVIVVGLITDGPRVGGGFDEIEAASAPPRSEALGGYAPSAVLSSVAFEDGQTLGAGVARGGASTPFDAQTASLRPAPHGGGVPRDSDPLRVIGRADSPSATRPEAVSPRRVPPSPGCVGAKGPTPVGRKAR